MEICFVLECFGGGEDERVFAGAAGDLEAHGEAGFGEAAGDGDGGQAEEIPQRRVAEEE
jgi:hypothetical protein